MASFYEGLAATALQLLTDKGQTISFSRDNVTSFDPKTGIETKGAAVTYSGAGAIFGFSKAEIDGTLIERGDKRLVLEAVTTVPAIGDAATVGGVVHRVMEVKPLNPGGTVVIYQLQLRV